MIVVIDNYDSFTYNLVQYLGELGAQVRVFRNDAVTIADVRDVSPRGVVISPGPGRPEDAGVTVPLIRELAGEIPILGVCLGHQGIAAAFGGRIVTAPKLVHGKTSKIAHDRRTIFSGLENPFVATRYHSLLVDATELPACLQVSAWFGDLVMGVRHRKYPIEGVQFHPESILTAVGKTLLHNFLSQCNEL